jgi:7-cyano-7-deazaguanine synthase
MKPGVVVLMSGGLDSAVLVLHYLAKGRRVLPLFVEGGLRWEDVELYWTRRFLRAIARRGLAPLEVLRLGHEALCGRSHWARSGKVPGLKASWDSVGLPGRNLLLLSAGATYASLKGANTVALGVLKGNPFIDARPAFYRALEKTLRLGLGCSVKIEAPFAKREKEELIKKYLHVPLKLTFSCIKPVGKKHCGRCTKCFERMRAFKRLGISDPAPYGARR